MKNTILILAVAFLIGCKKKTVDPIPPNDQCITGATNFLGKFVLQGGNYDTINIVFVKNNCPTKNSNTYNVYNLGKALSHLGSTVVFDTVKVYSIISSEDSKSAVTGGIVCQWGLNGINLNCNWKNTANVTFKKL